MNILSIADNFTGLFPSKITVTFINVINDVVVKICKLDKNDLPESFDKPTTMMISGETWRVIRVLPVNSRKKLTIYVVNPPNETEFSINNIVPTRANSSFNISWRQLEFLPGAMLKLVTEEFIIIDEILKGGGLLGYPSCYERVKIGMPSYRLPVNSINGYIEYIDNTFTLKSAYNNYYGIIEDDHITLLCLESFDCVNEELMELFLQHDIILVDWCNTQVIINP
jgi:hypothetical protein